jgi:hypothetical protein
VAPPRQHIGLGQHGFGQAMLGLVERGGAHVAEAVLAQAVGNGAVQAVGVDSGHLGVGLFVAAFVPYSNARVMIHGREVPFAAGNGLLPWPTV